LALATSVRTGRWSGGDCGGIADREEMLWKDPNACGALR
jgi:hypothetical protein